MSTPKKKKILNFVIFFVLILGVALAINHFREVEGYTIRELGREAVNIADEYLDGEISAQDAKAIIGSMLDAISANEADRRDPLTINEMSTRTAISGLHLNFTFPNSAQITTSRNQLARLVNVDPR